MRGRELGCKGTCMRRARVKARWAALAGGDRVGVLAIKRPLVRRGRNPGGMVTLKEKKKLEVMSLSSYVRTQRN